MCVDELNLQRELVNNQSALKVLRLTGTARLPVRADSGAVGYDLYADQDAIIEEGIPIAISTGIAVEMPEGCYGRIAPRSGLALYSGLDVLGGVIDPSYRGEIKVILIGFSRSAYQVTAGDRIAQLIIERACTPEVLEVTSLTSTVRGQSGFGSTGTSNQPDKETE